MAHGVDCAIAFPQNINLKNTGWLLEANINKWAIREPHAKFGALLLLSAM